MLPLANPHGFSSAIISHMIPDVPRHIETNSETCFATCRNRTQRHSTASSLWRGRAISRPAQARDLDICLSCSYARGSLFRSITELRTRRTEIGGSVRNRRFTPSRTTARSLLADFFIIVIYNATRSLTRSLVLWHAISFLTLSCQDLPSQLIITARK